jgi:hypothetical protein
MIIVKRALETMVVHWALAMGLTGHDDELRGKLKYLITTDE